MKTSLLLTHDGCLIFAQIYKDTESHLKGFGNFALQCLQQICKNDGFPEYFYGFQVEERNHMKLQRRFQIPAKHLR